MNSAKSNINQIVDHLFRREAGKIISVLTRVFGPENVQLSEDVVQDSLLEALHNWSYKGIPENPSGWLFKVAKNKAINILKHEKNRKNYLAENSSLINEIESNLDHFFSEEEILDDQLRMIFACCHPSISADSQVAFALKTLCGFGLAEIARAFLTTEENINKRLVRARKKMREAGITFEIPGGKELDKRLDSVLEIIYLLFNEGYSASKGNDLIRYELCGEAIRLAEIIESHPAIKNKSNVYSLLALMQLNASRFKSRADLNGNLLTMAEQDRSLWDRELIKKGISNLAKSTVNNNISLYQILAAISAYHCSAADYDSTNWSGILSLYDKLLLIDSSPVVLLNRTIPLSKVYGAESALRELKKLKNIPSLKSYHLLHSTEAEFYIQLNQFSLAAGCIEKALKLSSLKAERNLLKRRLNYCREKMTPDNIIFPKNNY